MSPRPGDLEFRRICEWLARERLTAGVKMFRDDGSPGPVVVRTYDRPDRRSRLTGQLKVACEACGAVGWHAEGCKG